MDTDETILISFTPGTVGVVPPGEGNNIVDFLPRLITGNSSGEVWQEFYDRWYGRVQHTLNASLGPDSPFAVKIVGE